MSKADSRCDVAIVGAGIAGLVLALALEQRGFAARVFEVRSRDSLVTEGAFLTLSPNALHGLAAVGLADDVVQDGIDTTGIEIFDERGKRLGFMDQRDHAAAFGAPSITIARARLMALLLEACEVGGITIEFEAGVDSITEEGHAVRLVAGGREPQQVGWIAGCDGLRSSVRGLVFPAYPRPHDTGLIGTGGIACIDAIPPTNGTMSMVFGHTGFFGYLKQPGGPVYWFNSFPAEALGKASAPFIEIDVLRGLHRGDPDIIDGILSRLPERVRTYPIHDMPGLPVWSSDRVVLVGDAAHAVGPHAGQGAAMAIEDAVTLAACATLEADLNAAFRRYEAVRRPRITEVARLTARNGTQKRATTNLDRLLRRLILPFALPLSVRSMRRAMAYRVDTDPRLSESAVAAA